MSQRKSGPEARVPRGVQRVGQAFKRDGGPYQCVTLKDLKLTKAGSPLLRCVLAGSVQNLVPLA